MKAMIYAPRQFDFGRSWRRRIVPILGRQQVQKWLHLGIILANNKYEPGDPPWRFGTWEWHRRLPRAGCLAWYQPGNKCHWIAPFSWAIGKELYPELNWGFVKGRDHTVVVGYRHRWSRPDWVFDILLFRRLAAAESLRYARRDSIFYPGPEGYCRQLFDNAAIRMASTEAIR